jgi:hypothetical protein
VWLAHPVCMVECPAPTPPTPAPVDLLDSLIAQTFHLNALETLYLATSMFVLLSGMAFQSGVAAPGTALYTALTYIVAMVLTASGCVSLFAVVFTMEAVWAVRFSCPVCIKPPSLPERHVLLVRATLVWLGLE